MTSIGAPPFSHAVGGLQSVSVAERQTLLSTEAHSKGLADGMPVSAGESLQPAPDQKVVQPLPKSGPPEPGTLFGMAERPVSPFDANARVTDTEVTGSIDPPALDANGTDADTLDTATALDEPHYSSVLEHRYAPARPLTQFAQIPTETTAEIQRLRAEIAENKPAPQEATGPAMSPLDRPPGAVVDIGNSVNTVRQIQEPEPHRLDVHR